MAILCGAAIGLVVAIVTVAYRADNMVTGLTANILAAGLTSYLLRVLSGGGRRQAVVAESTRSGAVLTGAPRSSAGR